MVNETMRVFLLILCASFLFSTLVSRIPRIRIPTAVGYLMFGMLLQTDATSMTANETWWLGQLGNFGLLFLMFLSGVEVDTRVLYSKSQVNAGSSRLYTAVTLFLGTLLLSFVFSFVFCSTVPGHPNPWMLTLLLTTTSLGVIVPILEEAGELHTELGQTLLMTALLSDFMTVLLVSVFVSGRTAGGMLHFFSGLAVLPTSVFLYWILSLIRRFPRLRRMAGDGQNRMRAVVALAAGLCAFANFTGAEPILGSFLAGVVVSALPFAHKARLRDYIHGLGYGLLIPLFFVSVGLSFDFRVFDDAGLWNSMGILALAAVAVKLIPAWQLRRTFGRRVAMAGGFLLTARLGLVVAASQVGVRVGAFPQWMADALVLVAVLTSLLAPSVFVSVMSRQGR